jgi:hypothetical protein
MRKINIIFLLFMLVGLNVNAGNYYVKVTATGDGSGTSWDNAMSGETFISKLASDIVSDDVIYMAGGVYKSQPGTTAYFVTLDKAITVIGGFAPGITGSTVDIVYPSLTPTVFSGDLNNDEIANSGDGYLISVNSNSGDITLKGITVTGGYSTTANRPGIHITNGNVKLYYCSIDGNVTTTTANNDAGGAGIYMANNSSLYAYKSSISNNSAANRGGSVRMANNSVLTLESCLLTGNSISGDYGGCIQGSSANTKVYCINTTIAYNTGNHGAGINTNGEVYLISSTVVNNTSPSTGSQGLDIRCESSEKMHFINSIITGSNGDGDAHIYLNGSNRKIISDGHNIFGKIDKSNTNSVFEAQQSDQTMYFANIFGSNILADNDGYPQTIALSNSLPGSTIEDLNAFKTTYQITVGDIAKDQRGFVRNTAGAVSIGAYEYSNITLSTDATLQQLVVTPGTLTPNFAANIFSYTVDVAYDIETIDITGTATDANAVVTGNVTGKSLDVGENTVTITVRAEDNLHTNDYVVTINRQQALSTDATLQQLEVSPGILTPDFNANIFSYTVDVAYDIETIDVTGTATDANAVVTGNVTGKSLDVGENTVTITVRAEDNLHTNDYVVTVNRQQALSTDATLQQLEVSPGTLTPNFAANIFSYTVDVAYDVETIDVTGTATDANAVVTGNVTGKSLDVGENTVTITVWAEDNLHTNDYVVTVNRANPTLISNLQNSLPYNVVTQGSSLEIKTNISGKLTVYDLVGKIIFDKAAGSGNSYIIPASENSIYLVKFNDEVRKIIVH